ncbi:MAG: YdcF family protein, partial [Pedobacter sp.]|nr:YdcF family protein [Pedobacter sp.]
MLGSANLPTLTNRVNIALDLYRIKKIDKIIVSGGCGAHTSSICEATEMKNLLVAKGVAENSIYKEENSKTTVQNYIFSRVLRDELGQKVIQENDSVFVVSDHWHAIAVAARLNKYDHVIAKFFIEGDLLPKPTDLLEYGGLFN